jgi:uncharacterized protein (DUF1499 family)
MSTPDVERFFETLERPDTPNNWLVAPADFFIKPDVVTPVFQVPVSVLIDTVRSLVLQKKGAAIVEESPKALHVVTTTPLMRFKDDVWALFIPVTERSSTLALYSSSRIGYWDLGTNRRRLKGWIERLQDEAGSSQR